MNDDLRSQLKKLDPMPPDVPTEPVTSESSRTRMEHIMSSPTIERPEAPSKPSRTRWYAAIAAAAVVVVAIGGVALLSNNGSAPVASEPLTLSAGASDSMASCIMLSAEILADMDPAFQGTVTNIEGDVVTLSIDRWFTSGDATEAVVTAPAGLEALIGGIPFNVGDAYLITATDGVVNYCGYSGPVTPELTALFEEAFPG
jgi:hypothetical protein